MNFLHGVVQVNPVHIYALCVFFGYLYLSKTGRLPNVESIRKLTSMLDDKGGNILVLGLLTVFFFEVAIKLFYYSFHLMDEADGHIRADNAILLMALNMASTGAFSTVMGALLTTMKGAMTVPPPDATTSGGLKISSTGNGYTTNVSAQKESV